MNLITDRTKVDVDGVEEIEIKMRDGTASAAEKAEYLAGMRASYNAADLNRVSAAAQYISERLRENGYIAQVFAKTDWAREDLPTAAQMETYLQNVQNTAAAFCQLPSTPALPETMQKLDYIAANAIEQNLVDIDFLIDCMVQEFTEHRKCGDFVCGDYDFLPNVETIFIMRGFNKSRKTAAELGAIGATWAEIREGAWQ